MPPFSVIMLGRARASTVKRPDICACVRVWRVAAGPLSRASRYCSFLGSQPGSVSIGFCHCSQKSEMFKKVLNVQDIHGFISFLFTQGLEQDCMTECEECDSVHVCLFVFALCIICMWTTFLYRNLGIYIFRMVKLLITKSTLELDIKAEN